VADHGGEVWHRTIVQNWRSVPQPRAPRGLPVATLPPRANLARYCLFTAAPLSFLTFIASSQSASPLARAVLLAAAVLSPLALIYVGLRTTADHDPVPVPGSTTAPGRAGRWDWSDVVAFVPAASAAVLLTGTVLLGFTQAVDSGLPAAARSAVESFAGQTASYAAALAALVVLLVWRRGLRARDLGWRLPRPLGRLGWLPWLAIGVVGAVVALLVAQWLGSLATDLLPNSPNTQCTTVRGEYGGYLGIAIPVVCLVAPLSEETIFRGFMYGWLRRNVPVLPAVVISAAVFSAAHLVLVLALPLFGVGVILALLYEYSDSLLPGAVVHGLFNLVGIIAILGATGTC
jgi:membrane protease YdiL (CAAX protease family)